MDLLLVLAKLWDFALYTALPFIVVLGIMIFVHESGHYLAARGLGIKVLIFKLGFGRYIWSFKRGDTEYGVAWFPIGGYVKLFGDPTEIEGGPEELSPEEIPESERKVALFFRPAGQKLLVFFAGPLMNILLAFLLAPLVYIIGVEQAVGQKGTPVVGIVEPGSPAQEAGVKPGDRVLSIDGEQMESFSDLLVKEALNPGNTVVYEIEREGQRIEVPIQLREGKPEPIGESGIRPPPLPSQVGDVMSGSPAQSAGLLHGDTIVRINDERIAAWSGLQEAVNNSEGRELELLVLRDGEQQLINVTPRYNPDYDRHLLGITPYLKTEFIQYGLGKAVVEGSKDCLHWLVLTYKVLWKLISFQLSPRTLQGPLGIGAITSDAAHSGIPALISFMVLISINLGILNLLPFPPLDGGHILVTATERIIGREIKMKYKEAAFRVGFMLLITLMVLVTVHDFIRYKTRMWEFLKDIVKGLGIG